MKVRRTASTLEICLLDAQCFPLDDVLSDDELHSSLWWLATEGSKIAGYVGLYVALEGETWLNRIGVLPDFRGQGLAHRLLRTALREAKHHAPVVRTYILGTNIASCATFARAGFVVTGVDGTFAYFSKALATQ